MRRASGVHAGLPWAEEFLAEAADTIFWWEDRYEPFRVWGNTEVHSKYINTDEGPTGIWRRTINSCETEQAAATQVWVLGGSAMVGADTPDFATIPSSLSQRLNAVGHGCVEVTNLGVMGYVIDQETILLTQLLKGGHRPDVVIFFGGANDAYVGAYSPGLAGVHGDLLDIKARVEKTLYLEALLEKSYALSVLRGVLRRITPPTLVGATDQGEAVPIDTSEEALMIKARQTLDNFEGNMTFVRALGREYGFQSYFFWQPILVFGDKLGTAFERLIREHPAFNDLDENRATVAVYREAERRAAEKGEFMFLGRIFDRVEEPIYVDQVHLGPRGNDIIAEAIATSVLAQQPR